MFISGRVEVPKAFSRWKKKHSWLTLISEGKSLCSICCEAIKKKLSLPKDSKSTNSRKAFVDEGF